MVAMASFEVVRTSQTDARPHPSTHSITRTHALTLLLQLLGRLVQTVAEALVAQVLPEVGLGPHDAAPVVVGARAARRHARGGGALFPKGRTDDESLGQSFYMGGLGLKVGWRRNYLRAGRGGHEGLRGADDGADGQEGGQGAHSSAAVAAVANGMDPRSVCGLVWACRGERDERGGACRGGCVSGRRLGREEKGH